MTYPQTAPRAAGRRWISLRLTLLAALLISMVALVFPMSSSASAYPISYTVINRSGTTMTFVSARIGVGAPCKAVLATIYCADQLKNGRDYSGEVSPRTVPTGSTFVVQSSLDIFTFQQKENIDVVYAIGAHGRVFLSSDPHKATCRVEAAPYACNQIGSPNSRTWEVVPK